MQKAHHTRRGQEAKVIGLILFILLLSLMGCEATETIQKRSVEFQDKVTETVEKTKAEAESLINEKKNEIIQDIVDEIKANTDIDLNLDKKEQ